MTDEQPDDLTRLWTEQPEMIREFLERRPRYERLCSEVRYILEKELVDAEIEISTITDRAKTLASFAEKIVRKSYTKPLREMTDLAGVRVVYLYRGDQKRIEQIIEEEFRVVEKVDNVDEKEPDEFGYGALHYLVKLGKRSSGARYDELKHLLCEVQVRTVLQDAWAIIDHHLSYKREADIPRELHRKLNALSAVFENADDDFERIRADRKAYIETVRKRGTNANEFLRQELNLDTFTEYLKWKFPEKQYQPDDSLLLKSLRAAQMEKLATLAQLDAVIERTEAARLAIHRESKANNPVTEINRALALVSPAYRARASYGEAALQRFKKYGHLVAKG